MNSAHHKQLQKLLARIDQQMAKAETLTVARSDDDTLGRSAKVLAELRQSRSEVLAKLKMIGASNH